MLLVYGASVPEQCPPKSCPLGMFCPIDTNCAANTSRCVVECPTESDPMIQGNWTSGNCERGTLYTATLYEVI